jgi:hypothetical protein
MPLTAETLIAIAMTNPANAELVRRLPELGLHQCMLTAGCLFQAVWNHQSGRPAEWGIKDYDIFYFDEDTSWEAENQVILAARALFHDLDANLAGSLLVQTAIRSRLPEVAVGEGGHRPLSGGGHLHWPGRGDG